MYQAMTLPNLATELKRQLDTKRDYLADTRRLRFQLAADDKPYLSGLPEVGDAELTANAHGQFAESTRIPKIYYDRMLREAPDLLVSNLNHWLDKQPAKKLVRTLDGKVRALLSDRFRPLDNWDFANAVLPALTNLGGEVRSCAVTDDKLYLKVVRPDLKAELLPPGAAWGKGHDRVDIIEAGLVLSNSEVGKGTLSIQPAVHTVACTNLAVFRDNAMVKTHLGRALGGEGEGDLRRYLSDKTRAAEDLLLWRKVAELTQAALDGRIFADLRAKLEVARGRELVNPVAAVERVGERFGLLESEQESVLDLLIKGRDVTQYGIHSAVTLFSQRADLTYDRASELEQIGGAIIDLPEGDWKRIAESN